MDLQAGHKKVKKFSGNEGLKSVGLLLEEK